MARTPVVLIAALFSLAPAAAQSMWEEPTDIKTRNLLYGSGGKEHEPKGMLTFVKEDNGGTNPKFDVRDEAGVKWKVKLGNEARPETVATRLVWATGFHTSDDYFLPVLHVEKLPPHLKRGQNLVQADGSLHDVRLKRDDGKKAGTWKWKENPFTGKRELNGLRVVMALINNWDLKDDNNAINGDGKIYLVSDLGASFGSTGLRLNHDKAKGNIDSYSHSKFISKTTPEFVSFNMPTAPSIIYIFNPYEYFSRIKLEWIGRRIPRSDVKWMAQLLSQLSPEQLHDAFRAAGYSAGECDAFAKVVSTRISEMSGL